MNRQKQRIMADRLIKWVIVVALMLPVGLVFNDNLAVQIIGGIYIFGMWLLLRNRYPREEEDERNY